MTATILNRDLCVEYSEWAQPGDIIVILAVEGRAHHSFAMYSNDDMWTQIDPEGITKEGELMRLEPEQVTSWRPAHINTGVPVELWAQNPWAA
ncbi:hypothetical protein [Nesterenkonia suensis]